MPDRPKRDATDVMENPIAPRALAAGRLHAVVVGDGTIATYPLPHSGRVTIGRGETCGILVEDQLVSRQHAALVLGPPMLVEDLGSANGTFLRGEKLQPNKPQVIALGETLTIGATAILLQEYAAPPRPMRLWTHDYWEARLEEECARAARTGASFGIVRIRLKVGPAISQVQSTLLDMLRSSDVLGLYSVSEYELLVADAPPEEVERTRDRILSRLNGLGVKPILGIACYPRDGRSPDALMARAGDFGTEPPAGTDGRVVADPAMKALYQMVERIAQSDLPVLLLGETGVGKEVFAETVHRLSPRKDQCYLKLNCAAFTETLLESELFGHERGAFTHAVQTKPGLLETASGGTVLLDEVGDLPLALQAKLLRVLEERTVHRVGGLKPRPIDVRFIAATNRDLEADAAEGTFRRDLYFRLNGVSLVIPPLRQRLGEIEPLARTFAAAISARLGRPPPRISPEALELLRGHQWPGNLRELRNVIERAVLLCQTDQLDPEHLPAEKLRASSSGAPVGPHPGPAVPGAALKARPEDEQRLILEALERAAGNQTRAAELLGISRRTLVSRLAKYGVPRPRKGKSDPPSS